MSYTTGAIARVLPGLDDVPADARARILTGVRAVLDALPDGSPADALRAALVAVPHLHVDDALHIAGPPARRTAEVNRALFTRPDLSATTAANVLRGERRKTARRELASLVRSIPLADALAATGDQATLIELAGAVRMPAAWRGRLAAELVVQTDAVTWGVSRAVSDVRYLCGKLPNDAVEVLLDELPNLNARLVVALWENVVTGPVAWTRFADRLTVELPKWYPAGKGRTIGHYHELRRVLAAVGKHASMSARARLLPVLRDRVVTLDGRPLEELLRLPVPAESQDPARLDWRSLLYGQLAAVRPGQLLTVLDDAFGDDPHRWVVLARLGDRLHGSAADVLSAVTASTTEQTTA